MPMRGDWLPSEGGGGAARRGRSTSGDGALAGLRCIVRGGGRGLPEGRAGAVYVVGGMVVEGAGGMAVARAGGMLVEGAAGMAVEGAGGVTVLEVVEVPSRGAYGSNSDSGRLLATAGALALDRLDSLLALVALVPILTFVAVVPILALVRLVALLALVTLLALVALVGMVALERGMVVLAFDGTG